MELIAKVTQKCDMACSFCAASGCSEHVGLLQPEEIAEAAKKLDTDSIILAGGEVLTLPPAYYEKLLSLTPSTARIELVSNLKDFSLHPSKWEKLFKNPRISVCTSFNYGKGRRWDKDTVYDEAMFKDTIRKFKDHIGYIPMFIAVIDKDNVDTWRKHIELAKSLGTICRLNNALKIGRSGEYFPRSRMFQIWTQVVKEGLDSYELNAANRGTGKCPCNGNLLCKNTIRVMKRNTAGEIRYYRCDDDSNKECNGMTQLDNPPPTPLAPQVVLKPQCYSCELFRLCNGCESNALQIEDKDEYCRDMLSIKKELLEQGWLH